MHYLRRPYSNELYHHGIMGMKWGKRNGPPYPLSSEAHSASEKRAGWRQSLNSKNRVGDKLLSDRQKEISDYEKDLPKEKNHLTEEQKKTIRNVAIGVAATAGIGVGIYVAYRTHAIKTISEQIENGASKKL